MTEKQVKFWSMVKIKGRDTASFMDIPIELSSTETMTRSAPVLNDALRKVILGKSIDVPINEIATAVRNALRDAGQEHPIVLSKAVEGLALERKSLIAKPQNRKRSATSGATRKQPRRRLRDVMAEQAAQKPKPEYKPDETHYETIGKWAYDPKGNHVFYDGEYQDLKPRVANGLGLIIEAYPIPKSVDELVIEVQGTDGSKGYDFEINSTDRFTNEIKVAAKIDKEQPSKASFRTNISDGRRNDTLCLAIDLTDLSDEIKDCMDIVTDRTGRVSVSRLQRLLWIDGTSDMKVLGTGTKFDTLANFFENTGVYIPADEFKKIAGEKLTPSSAKVLNNKLEKLGLPERVFLDEVPPPTRGTNGCAICTDTDEWEKIIKAHYTTLRSGTRPSGNQGETFAPEF